MNQQAAPNLGIVLELVKRFRLAWLLFIDQRVPLWTKFILPLSWLYVISPIDLIPDAVLGLGQLDDLGVLLLALALFVKLCPQDIVQDYLNELGYGANYDDDNVVHTTYQVKEKD